MFLNMINLKIAFVSIFVFLAFTGFTQKKYDLNHYEGLPTSIEIRDIKLNDGLSAYVATDKGLFFVSSVSVEARNIVPKKSINAISDFEGNKFYIGGGNQFASSENLGKFISFGNKSVKVNCLQNYKNELWIGTNDGIYVVNKNRGNVINHYIPGNSKLKSKDINFIYKDIKNTLWVGTKNGIVIIKGDKWDIEEKSHSMEAIFENSEGLWLLSNKELWNIDNFGKLDRWYRINLKKDLKKGIVNDLVLDSKGRLIIASDILVRFDPVTDKIEKYGQDLGLVAKNCTAIAIDREDRVWIGTKGNGLFTVGFKDHFKRSAKGAPMEFVMISKSPSCAQGDDGSIKLIVKGGKKPYDFKWSTGDEGIKKIENLTAGNYSVTITDAKDSTMTKDIVLVEPDPLKISVESITKDLTGVGSVVAFNIEGGSPGYLLDIDGYTYDNPAKDVSPGEHTAKVVDVFGCDAYVDFKVKGDKIMKNLDASNIKVGQVVRINNLYFQADSTDITSKSKPVLDEIFLFLQENAGIVVEIGGHTNNIPSDEYCDRLSTARAKHVAEYLIKRGIDKSRISFKGYGKRKPIASNSTAAGRKKNQRVEMKILSIK